MKPNITINIKCIVKRIVVAPGEKPESIEKQMVETFSRVLNLVYENSSPGDDPNCNMKGMPKGEDSRV